jgi:hypothetical protein
MRLGEGVLYVGMNSTLGQCDVEANFLERNGPGVRRIAAHGERLEGGGADHVRVGTEILDLSDGADLERFCASLALSSDQASALHELFIRAPAGSRDELAGIAVAFAQGEHGADVPSRLVLSGHCTGTSVYDGMGTLGELRFEDVLALGRLMPRAAQEIEDVMLSACSTGYDLPGEGGFVALREWRDVFPNLKTVWAYGGISDFHSPTGTGALKHIEAWERATRGRATRLDPRAALAQINGGHAVGYDRNVSVWTVAQGYVQGK